MKTGHPEVMYKIKTAETRNDENSLLFEFIFFFNFVILHKLRHL